MPRGTKMTQLLRSAQAMAVTTPEGDRGGVNPAAQPAGTPLVGPRVEDLRLPARPADISAGYVLTPRAAALRSPAPAPTVRVSLARILLAFLAVIGAALSLALVCIATLIVAGLIRVAHQDWPELGVWCVALALVVSVPVGLAVWKHSGESRALRGTMVWIPAVTSASMLVACLLLLPDPLAESLRNLAWVSQGRLGVAHPTTQALSALGHRGADSIREPQEEEPALPPLPGLDANRAVHFPFEAQGAGIVVPVYLEGPRGRVEQRYLFDTGASFTTITSSLAEQIGLTIPADAPELEFSTASGIRRSRMVVLDAIYIGDTRLEGLLVSVCDTCPSGRTDGLLGLNATRNFMLQLDYLSERLDMVPREQTKSPNRAYDMEPMLKMSIEGRPEIWLGRVRWLLRVENRSTRVMRDVVPKVRFESGVTLYGEPIKELAPRETARSIVAGKVGEAEKSAGFEFSIALSEGHW